MNDNSEVANSIIVGDSQMHRFFEISLFEVPRALFTVWGTAFNQIAANVCQ